MHTCLHPAIYNDRSSHFARMQNVEHCDGRLGARAIEFVHQQTAQSYCNGRRDVSAPVCAPA